MVRVAAAPAKESLVLPAPPEALTADSAAGIVQKIVALTDINQWRVSDDRIPSAKYSLPLSLTLPLEPLELKFAMVMSERGYEPQITIGGFTWQDEFAKRLYIELCQKLDKRKLCVEISPESAQILAAVEAIADSPEESAKSFRAAVEGDTVTIQSGDSRSLRAPDLIGDVHFIGTINGMDVTVSRIRGKAIAMGLFPFSHHIVGKMGHDGSPITVAISDDRAEKLFRTITEIGSPPCVTGDIALPNLPSKAKADLP